MPARQVQISFNDKVAKETREVLSEVKTMFRRVSKPTHKKLVFGARVTNLANDYSEAFVGIGFSSIKSQSTSPETISLNQALNENKEAKSARDNRNVHYNEG
ncbi:hypothetical protein OnM2_055007 [Erysiphe neolycopersici]|uniref:Uncharacterized protein n=1 Tax=Erysiphe neolycopersici TaxID=212602 RepID=A0A420HRG7_9PEZI|nr:hypothetical protein OnM2_055007 [Erysiphe neolycopersici]